MKISQAIKYLLITENQVIIPSFGILTATEKKAFIDKTRQEILPPTKKITFKADTTLKDSKIAKFIAEHNNLTIAEANQLIEDFVKEAQNSLNTSKTYRLGDIGTLKKNIAGEIIFTQNPNLSLNIQTFGHQKQKITITEPSTEQHKKKKKSFAWLWISLIILVVAGLGFLYRDHIIKFNKKEKKEISTNTPKKQPIDTLKQNLSTEESDIKLFDKNGIQYTIIYLGAKYEPYYIISGSYKYTQGATERIKQLNKYGYKAFIIKVNQYNRVAINGYRNPQQVIDDYNKFISRTNQEAWVLINRK